MPWTEAALLFGRGMRAGIDRREQKKQLVSLERDSLRRARAAAGIEETTETRRQEREREKLADQYDGFDMRVRQAGTLFDRRGGRVVEERQSLESEVILPA